MFLSFQTLIAATAYDSGRLYGSVTVYVLVAAGAIHCFKIATRPTTNAKACRGLGIDLVALFCMKVGQTAQPFIPSSVGLILLFAGLGLLLIGAVVAIIGLIEIARAPHGRYQQGLRQGVGAMIMSLLLGLIVFTNMASDSAKAAQPSNQMPQKSVYTFGEFGLQISGLPPAWARLEVRSSNPSVCAEFERQSPRVLMRVMAQKANDATLDSIVSADLENMKNRATSFQIKTDKPATVAGLPGREIIFQVQPKNLMLDYVEYAVLADGYCYKFFFWKDHDAESALQEESASVMPCVSFKAGK